MITKNLDQVHADGKMVEWGNGTSHRLLTKSDGMGFSVCRTLVRRGTSSNLEYSKHLEACYCIEGSGEVATPNGKKVRLLPGTIYALNDHDQHTLIADEEKDLVLISVFLPALVGDEVHDLADSASGY